VFGEMAEWQRYGPSSFVALKQEAIAAKPTKYTSYSR
jgi:hypothetical protein